METSEQKVARIKREIASGTFVTEERLEQAVASIVKDICSGREFLCECGGCGDPRLN